MPGVQKYQDRCDWIVRARGVIDVASSGLGVISWMLISVVTVLSFSMVSSTGCAAGLRFSGLCRPLPLSLAIHSQERRPSSSTQTDLQ
uniref:Uncharacterized protein n=1 Tax=Oryza brachyantha TaxID=4533 RepID=J3ML30_ORYBR